jgi:hypothetical protein
MGEYSALELTAVRAIEMADRAHALWTDADREWASRAAAEAVGEGSTPEAFLAQRAQLALARLGERFKAVPRAMRALQWRPWLGTVIGVAAFATGVAIDRIDDTQSINILTPPVLALLAWNLAVYLGLAISWGRRPGDPGRPLRQALRRLAGGLTRPPSGGALGAAMAQLAADWSRLAGPLYAARAARILHLAAALLAAGLLAGLYLRGLAFEYRATWQSTFLDAGSVRRLLAVVLAPGAALTGMAVPPLAEIEAIRAPAGENAARWLHLMASTVVLMVIVPRLLLALVAWWGERQRATQLPIALDEAYFDRLLRSFHGGSARVSVVPYSYTLPPLASTGLARLVARAFGDNATLTLTPPLAYGGDQTPARLVVEGSGITAIALFNATATPEREVHGAFLAALGEHLGAGRTLIALVDEHTFRAHWGDAARLDERRRAWRELCVEARVPCAFVDLAAAATAAGATATSAVAFAESAAAIERALDEASR